MLTEKTPAPFISIALVERIAQMLNYVLMKIAGPNCIDLKVSGPRQCNSDDDDPWTFFR
jgi:hypothetical protein